MSQFKFLSLEERQALAEDEFGDPERRLFPILSQEDFETALASLLPDMDEVKKRIFAIAKRKGFELPEGMEVPAFSEAEETESGDDANFSEFSLEEKSETNDNQYVLRTGKIFAAGSYPDKRFEMTPEELCAAIKNFTPVDIDLEHINTVLDGKLGRLEAVALGSDGWSLVGTVRLPKWLDDQLGDSPRKVSATWDRATKTLKKLALVRNPRVKDAVLMAAFTADELRKAIGSDSDFKETDTLIEKLTVLFDMMGTANKDRTYEGAYVLQTIHDIAARAGAVCKSEYSEEANGANKEEDSEFVSARESMIIQQMHDAAVMGGAKCRFKMEGSNNGEEDDDDEKYSDSSSDYSASADTNIKEIKEMNFKDIIAFFKNLPEDANFEDAIPTATEAAVEAETAPEAVAEPVAEAPVAEEVVENSGPSERELELEKQVQALKTEGVLRDASAFADEVISSGVAMPSEREAIVGLFSQAAFDDESNEAKITFNNEGKNVSVNRVEALKALFSVKKPHVLTEEQVEGEGVGVLVTNSGDAEVDYSEEAAKQAREFAQKRNAKSKK